MMAPAEWRALVAAVEAAYPREACGWLGADGVRCAAPGTRAGFAFGDADLLALARAPRPRALFHSHPDGDVTLSAADLAALAPGGVALYPVPHLVVAVAGGQARAAALWAVAPAPRLLASFRRPTGGAAAWRPTPAAP